MQLFCHLLLSSIEEVIVPPDDSWNRLCSQKRETRQNYRNEDEESHMKQNWRLDEQWKNGYLCEVLLEDQNYLEMDLHSQRRPILSLEALVFPNGTDIPVKDEGPLYRQWRGPGDL